MSRYFVDDAPIPIFEFDPSQVISDAKPNVIWIKSKMDYATAGKVKSALFALSKDNKTELHIGEQETHLLIHNIVRWEGPDFDGVPCTAERIMKMNPQEPHMARVLDEIATRNAPPKAPKEPTTEPPAMNGSATDLITQEPSNERQALVTNGALKPRSLSAYIGVQKKLDD